MARDDARLAVLDRQLRALGPQLTVPDAGSVATAVRRRIESGTSGVDRVHAPELRTRRRILVAAVAIVFVLVVGTVLAIGKSRDAVADWLGLRGVHVERSSEPLTGIGTDLHLGRRVSMADARERLGFDPLVAARAQYGSPDEVYVADHPAGGRVTFLYRPRPGLPPAAGSGIGLLITEFEADINQPVLGKVVGPNTAVDTFLLDGQTAYWLEGAPHAVSYSDRNGKDFIDDARLAGNTLLFARGPRTIRVESGLTKAEALALANRLERA